MQRIELTRANFLDAIEQCHIYILSAIIDEESEKTITAYMDEIKRLTTWKQLINTGIFHDAIGKVVNSTDSYVEIETEY